MSARLRIALGAGALAVLFGGIGVLAARVLGGGIEPPPKPKGWVTYCNPVGGWAIDLPPGWRRSPFSRAGEADQDFLPPGDRPSAQSDESVELRVRVMRERPWRAEDRNPFPKGIPSQLAPEVWLGSELGKLNGSPYYANRSGGDDRQYYVRWGPRDTLFLEVSGPNISIRLGPGDVRPRLEDRRLGERAIHSVRLC